jgi:ubiquitin C-terminal hydrolase
VLHIKRFRYTTFRREKMSTDVDFPMTGLDITPFVSAELQSEHSDVSSRPPLYDLAGVAHHSGSMNGGHYIAHVDTKGHCSGGEATGPAETSGQNWVCFNDARVSPTSSAGIGGPSAYILFYRQQNF